MPSREELFEKAKLARKEEKENEGRRGSNFTYDDIKWSALQNNAYKVYRLLGNPIDVRGDDPFSPKMVTMSRIIGDNGKYFRVIWPNKKDNENWFLYKVYDKVMAYTWDKASQSRVYHNQKKYPEVFNRVFKNGKVDNTYESGWKTKQVVLINAIDRGMMDWHKENKKTCLLSRNVNEGDNDVFYYDFGIPFTTYTKIFDEVVSYAGDWESYDILIRRFSDDPYYKVFHASDDRKKFADEMKLVKGSLDYADAPLTEEERSWERWNIDKYSKVTSYTKIMNRLKVFIQEVDAVFKTRFYDELEALVAKEKAEKEEESDDEDSDESSHEEVADTPKAQAPAATAPARPARPPKQESEKTTLSVEDLTKAGFKGVSLLSPENIRHITGISGNELLYSPDAGQCYSCVSDDCGYPAPETFTHCPKCGLKF